ncbi:C2H2 type zinc-finger domain-containing protein [Trichoderma gracile]
MTAIKGGTSPSFCRLCNIPLVGVNEWRQHAKSDSHIYNLRVRIAEPGTVVSPLASSMGGAAVEAKGESHHDDNIDNTVSELSEFPTFDAAQCLFCGARNGTFDNNLAHMSKKHSFAIPHQDSLIVEPDVLLEHLHLVVYGYGECILCATRRSTVQGIQHHMMAKGHCRFNVALDIAEFYDVPVQEFQAAGELLRLTSGKLIGRREIPTGGAILSWKRSSRESRRLDSITSSPSTLSRFSEVILKEDDNIAATSHTQLSRLSRGDQQNLAHLCNHELRSLLATSTRNINHLKRKEKETELKLEMAGNTTLTGHFRMDTSKRFRGPWG